MNTTTLHSFSSTSGCPGKSGCILCLMCCAFNIPWTTLSGFVHLDLILDINSDLFISNYMHIIAYKPFFFQSSSISSISGSSSFSSFISSFNILSCGVRSSFGVLVISLLFVIFLPGLSETHPIILLCALI